jgi:hypothetical protein
MDPTRRYLPSCNLSNVSISTLGAWTGSKVACVVRTLSSKLSQDDIRPGMMGRVGRITGFGGIGGGRVLDDACKCAGMGGMGGTGYVPGLDVPDTNPRVVLAGEGSRDVPADGSRVVILKLGGK